MGTGTGQLRVPGKEEIPSIQHGTAQGVRLFLSELTEKT